MMVEGKWRLGDELMMLPIYQILSEGNAYQDMKMNVLCNFPELLENNPYVDYVNRLDIRPHNYLNLRHARRDVERLAYYENHIGSNEFDSPVPRDRPTLYFEDWHTVLLDDIPTGDGPVVALCRGASWETKRWPEENWLALGQALEAEGCRVIVLGQEGEGIDVGTDFCGRTGVRDAACLLHYAALCISNDSGLMHLSLAADTRTIGLFGPTDPAILIENDDRFHPITNKRECQGCWNNDLSIEEPGSCPKDIVGCMNVIDVEQVLASARKLLGEPQGSSE
jgi:ADP-heptose:LPS heptosyltransferase